MAKGDKKEIFKIRAGINDKDNWKTKPKCYSLEILVR